VLSIVIPTLDAGDTLAATLAALGETAFETEAIVADGGSRDATRTVAEAAGARFVGAPRGRGVQLDAGAAEAGGEWLLFLHADTVPATGWAKAVEAFMADPANRRRAAYLRFALDDPALAARWLEHLVGWRCRILGLPFGDQGLLMSRALYDEVEGYRPWPLMEDVDIVRRIGRRRLIALQVPAVTSAAAYRRGGYVRRPLRNLACLALYFLGVAPRLIERLYR
jgi:rSAM/selenodomain-associated transferase 2